MKSRLGLLIIIVIVALILLSVNRSAKNSDNILLDDVVLTPSLSSLDYTKDIKPVLEQRCVVCHACYDAPCQLKLGSAEGLSRGANKDPVYDGERLIQANLTRLFEDAHSTAQWREKGFFPVMSDSPRSTDENLKASVMAKILLQKQAHPLPEQKLLPDSFELDLNSDYQCPTNDEFGDYLDDYALWGMPYGLPGLNATEHQHLVNWIANGGKNTTSIELTKQTKSTLAKWETFLNQDSLKAQLMSRYLFEHLFLVNLYLDDEQPRQFFKLVRSATKPGEEIKGIFTRRPFDDPKVERVYYRLELVTQSIAHKSHMPMKLDSSRQQRWKKWFIDTDYQVAALPSYKSEQASNPFITFAQIPVKSRYRYMLDESQNTIMQFIKGPVCRGQMALNVINDHFWVVFADPELPFVENNDQFMQQARQNIALPAEEESNALPTSWMAYAKLEKEYIKAKSTFIEQNIKDKIKVNLDLLWDGDKNNDNATLTVFRHNDAATVVKGLVGDTPQTAWVLTYPLFERIHYLLVAGYDVYGNVGHQLNSRMYMDFLRMEGEFNFLNLLPIAYREKVRNKWYRGSVSKVEEYVYDANQVVIESDIKYLTDDPLYELYQNFKQHFAKVSSQKHALDNAFSQHSVLDALTTINSMQGQWLQLLPNSSIVRIIDEATQSSHFYTLLRHNAHSNISHLFDEEDRRLPQEDTLSFAPGLLTSHPNAFFSVTTKQMSDFAMALTKVSSEQDYTLLKDQYGVRRTSDQFWPFADAMHAYFSVTDPQEFGILDFNRLENR